MFKKLIYGFSLGIIIVPLFAPISAMAAPNIWPTGFWGPIVSCTGNPYNTASVNSNAAAGTVPYSENKNACTSLCDLVNTAINIIYFGISFALFITTPILFAWGGIKFMISEGNPNGISGAKKILTGAIVGLLIVLGAWLIVNTIVGFLNISNVGGFSLKSCNVNSQTNTNNLTNGTSIPTTTNNLTNGTSIPTTTHNWGNGTPISSTFKGFGGGSFSGGGDTGSW
jgi:uncharacterized membrane protein YgcG